MDCAWGHHYLRGEAPSLIVLGTTKLLSLDQGHKYKLHTMKYDYFPREWYSVEGVHCFVLSSQQPLLSSQKECAECIMDCCLLFATPAVYC